MVKKKPNYGQKAAETMQRTHTQDKIAAGEAVPAIPESEAGRPMSEDSPSTKKRAVSPTNANTTQISFRIPIEYRRAMKLYALEHDTTINELFRSMLGDWLRQNNLIDG